MPTNILVNPSYELGQSPWQTAASPPEDVSFSIITTGGGHNSDSWFAATTTAEGDNDLLSFYVYQTVNVILASDYTISVWVQETMGFGQFSYTINLDGQPIFSSLLGGDLGWTQLLTSASLTIGSHTIALYVFPVEDGTMNQVFGIDDWVVEPSLSCGSGTVPSSSSSALSSSSIAVLSSSSTVLSSSSSVASSSSSIVASTSSASPSPSCVPIQTNIFTNPSYELGQTPWQASAEIAANIDFSIATSGGHNSNNYLAATSEVEAFRQLTAAFTVSQTVNVLADTQVALSVWVLSPGVSQNIPYCIMVDGQIAYSTQIVTSSQWSQLSTTITLAAGSHTIGLFVNPIETSLNQIFGIDDWQGIITTCVAP